MADPAAAEAAAAELLGSRLVTRQTGPAGLPVDAVLVEECVAIARELYLSVVIDNAAGLPMVIASAAGGVEIEQVAAERPAAIHRQHVDPTCGLQPFQARALAFATGLDGALLAPATRLVDALVAASRAAMRACWRSTRWWSPSKAPCWPAMPSSTWTTTRCSGSRSLPGCVTAARRRSASWRRTTPGSTTS